MVILDKLAGPAGPGGRRGATSRRHGSAEAWSPGDTDVSTTADLRPDAPSTGRRGRKLYASVALLVGILTLSVCIAFLPHSNPKHEPAEPTMSSLLSILKEGSEYSTHLTQAVVNDVNFSNICDLMPGRTQTLRSAADSLLHEARTLKTFDVHGKILDASTRAMLVAHIGLRQQAVSALGDWTSAVPCGAKVIPATRLDGVLHPAATANQGVFDTWRASKAESHRFLKKWNAFLARGKYPPQTLLDT